MRSKENLVDKGEDELISGRKYIAIFVYKDAINGSWLTVKKGTRGLFLERRESDLDRGQGHVRLSWP